VSLREELEFLDRYLEIEQIRFGERLQVRRDVDAAVIDAEVPALLLQPLVENAIRHGIARRPGAGSIHLEIRRVGDEVHITVRDTGPGFSEEVLARTREGVGLGNTRARLEQLHGDRHALELCNAADGGAVVRVRLPYRPCRELVAHYARDMRSA
jgi:sensor histidine kinase YesM